MYGIRRVTVISFFATDVMEVENHYLDWTSQVAHKGKGPSPSLRAKKRNVCQNPKVQVEQRRQKVAKDEKTLSLSN